MKILAIETSCDESAISVLNASGEALNPVFDVLASSIHSQIDIHAEYGGVFPSLAKREHMRNLPLVFETVMKKLSAKRGGKTPNQETLDVMERNAEMRELSKIHVFPYENPDIEAIAITIGPGLEPALWVGISFAQALSLHWNIPVIPVNHMKGHLFSVMYENKNITWPALALLVSGGHTEIIYAKDWNNTSVIGRTRDDAAGEAFDKVARTIGLPYPGGPEISKLAKIARNENRPDFFNFPRPMKNSDDFDFSFSGLKTSVMYAVKKHGEMTQTDKENFARSFEDAVIETLCVKVIKAIKKYNVSSLIVAGGVASNEYLRDQISLLAKRNDVNLHISEPNISTDNATMIGMAGYIEYLQDNQVLKKNPLEINALGNLSI